VIERLLFDNLFNVVLLILLLNLIFGIIVDTFAELRSESELQKQDMRNTCTVCSVERTAFDRSTEGGFSHHIESEHNMWHYIYLMAYIAEKEPTEFTGLESYIAGCIEAQECSFFPVRRAMALGMAEEWTQYSSGRSQGRNTAESSAVVHKSPGKGTEGRAADGPGRSEVASLRREMARLSDSATALDLPGAAPAARMELQMRQLQKQVAALQDDIRRVVNVTPRSRSASIDLKGCGTPVPERARASSVMTPPTQRDSSHKTSTAGQDSES